MVLAMKVDLSRFENAWFETGRSLPLRLLWLIFNALILQNPFNFSSFSKIVVLKMFGASIGTRVNLKPSISVKYPWNLTIGNNSWIGEKVWLDSLGDIEIGNNCCISQGVYLCTGNHDWSDPCFGLMVSPIKVESGAWIGAKSVVLPGVTIASHCVITAGSIVSKSTEPFMIYTGNMFFLLSINFL